MCVYIYIRILFVENDPSKCLEDKGNGLVPDNDCIDCSPMWGKPAKQKCADGYVMNSSPIYDVPHPCIKITCTKPGIWIYNENI